MVDKSNQISGVLVIQGWVGDEFIVVKQLPTFWDWLKFAIDDIRDWIEDWLLIMGLAKEQDK